MRLGDADVGGHLRLDGAARSLQDVATDDWTDTGVVSTTCGSCGAPPCASSRGPPGRGTSNADPDHLVRRRRRGLGRTAHRHRGRRRARRRGRGALGADGSQRADPVRLRESFFDVYGESAQVAQGLGTRRGAAGARGRRGVRRGPCARADLDLVGHVNNAAVWQALSEVVRPPVRQVSVIHHRAIERDDDVTLADAPGACGCWSRAPSGSRSSYVA